jgi:hypothetical protein
MEMDMSTNEEIRRYLDSIEDKDSFSYAATEFLSRAVASQLLARAAEGLTDAISSYNLALRPAKILMLGYTAVDPSVKDGWELTEQFGRFVILTAAAGPLGALVGGATLGLSVLAVLDRAEARAAQERRDELIASMAEKLDAIREKARVRIEQAREEARRRDTAPATDADRADRRNVLAVVGDIKFTPNEKARTLTFLEHTLEEIRDDANRPLRSDQRRQRRRFGELGNNDLALIYAMGEPLIERGNPQNPGERASMMDFEVEVLSLMQLIFEEREAEIADEDPAQAVPAFPASTVRGSR